MDSYGEVVGIIGPYEEKYKPYCKLQKEAEADTYQIPLHGFKIGQFKIRVNEKKGTMKIEGERPLDGTRWSHFCQEFKVPSDVYNTKDITARFVKGVLSITVPRKEPYGPSVSKSLLLMVKTSKGTILRIAIAVVVGVAVGGYAALRFVPSKHVIEKH